MARLEQIRAFGRHIRENPGFDRVPAQSHGGVIVMGYPTYDDETWSGLWTCYEEVGADRDYRAHLDELWATRPSDATWAHLSTYFTFLARGERFCDGLIAAALEDGTLLAMTDRLIELIEAGEPTSRTRGTDR